MKSHKAYLT